MTMPVQVGPRELFVSESADLGGAVLRVQTDSSGAALAEKVWHNREMKTHFTTAVSYGGYLYGFDNATLKCLDPADGSRQWARRGYGKGSLLAADGLFFVLSDRGRLVLAEASHQEFQERGSAQVLDGKTWTLPTLSGGCLYLRDHDEMVCLEVGS